MLLHWALYHLGLHRANTQLSIAETTVLIELARQCDRIVELGVFEGASSYHLRRTMRPTGTLYCVDPFYRGSFGFSYGYSIASREVGKSKNGEVVFIRALSHEASQFWFGVIDLLFIDADHAFEAVSRDWREWTPFVRPGGFVALHDSCEATGRCNHQDGPVQLVQELQRTPGHFSLLHQIDTLSVFRRREEAGG